MSSEKENINPATGRHMRDDWRPEDVLRERLPQFASSHAGLKTPTQDPVTPQTSERTPLADITPMFMGVKVSAPPCGRLAPLARATYASRRKRRTPRTETTCFNATCFNTISQLDAREK